MSMEFTPLVSIIVPIYNVEKYVDKCITSIINQSYKNIEIVLVDDGSKDKSGEICDFYAGKDNRIIVIHKPNGGLSDARNCGIEKASGEYLCFVDGDDYIHSKTIEVSLHYALQNNAKIVQYGFNYVYDETSMDDTNISLNDECVWTENERYIIGMCTYIESCSFCDKLFHKSILKNYRFSLQKNNEDLLLLSRILIENSNYNILKINHSFYYYVQRSNSISSIPFGKTVTDTVYNCYDLVLLCNEKRQALTKYYIELLLFQIRSFLIQMPREYIKQRNNVYLFAADKLKKYSGYVHKAFFTKKDKLFLILFLKFPSLTKFIISFKKS